MTEIEQKQNELWLKSSLRSIQEGNVINRNDQEIAKGVEDVPVNIINGYALQIENNILPEIQKRRGVASEDYKLFRGIFKSCLWCITIVMRYDRLRRSYIEQKMLREFYQERAEYLEKKLNDYATMEDIYFSQAQDFIAAGIEKRAKELLKK